MFEFFVPRIKCYFLIKLKGTTGFYFQRIIFSSGTSLRNNLIPNIFDLSQKTPLPLFFMNSMPFQLFLR